jgi:hypothetical protein
MGSGNGESVYGAVIEAAAESEMRVGVGADGKKGKAMEIVRQE